MIKKLVSFPKVEAYDLYLAASGVNLDKFVKYVSENNGDMSNLAGIPGSIGGAVVGNAGAYGSEIRDFLVSVNIINDENQIKTLSCEDLLFDYRESIFKSRNWVILTCIFKIPRNDKEEILTNIAKITALRHNKLPINEPSLGSIFKNIKLGNDKIPIAQFIQSLCLDTNINGLTFYPNHANIIINTDNKAGADDLLFFIDLIKQKLFEFFGLIVETEIRFIT